MISPFRLSDQDFFFKLQMIRLLIATLRENVQFADSDRSGWAICNDSAASSPTRTALLRPLQSTIVHLATALCQLESSKRPGISSPTPFPLSSPATTPVDTIDLSNNHLHSPHPSNLLTRSSASLDQEFNPFHWSTTASRPSFRAQQNDISHWIIQRRSCREFIHRLTREVTDVIELLASESGASCV